MKTLLHYLNWFIYDFRNLLWNSLVIPTLKCWGLIALTIFLCIPIYFVSNEVFWYVWTFIVMVFLTFFIITYMHYFGSRRITHNQPEYITEISTGLQMKVEQEPSPDPFTFIQSMEGGVKWTWYLFLVIIVAVILTGVFGQYIPDLINHIL
jgi:hypothetical protein